MKISTEIQSFKKFGTNKEILKLLKDSGFDAYDFSMFFDIGETFVFCDDYVERAKELRKYADSIGIVCNQSHAPFPTVAYNSNWCNSMRKLMEKRMLEENNGKYMLPKTGDEIEYYNECLVELLKRGIEITSILGGKAIVIHPNSNYSTEQNVVFYNQFKEVAVKNNVKIALENMWGWDNEKNHATYASCSDGENFMEHLNMLDKDVFVACVDIGHAEMMGEITNSSKLLEDVSDRLFCLHIHDNDLFRDKHMLPFNGSVDFEKVTETLAKIGYNGDITFECTTFMPKFDKEFFPVATKFMYEIGNYLREKIQTKKTM